MKLKNDKDILFSPNCSLFDSAQYSVYVLTLLQKLRNGGHFEISIFKNFKIDNSRI